MAPLVVPPRPVVQSLTAAVNAGAVGNLATFDTNRAIGCLSVCGSPRELFRIRPGRADGVRLAAVSNQAALQSWHDFYLVVGPAAASLVGLLFVGLTLHLRAVLARDEVRGLARATFSNFALVLIVALLFVIPQDASALGTQLIIAALVSLGVAAPAVASAARSQTRTLAARQLVLRFGLSAAGYVVVGVAGGLITAARPQGLSLLATAVIALLVISLRNSWDLLVSVGDVVLAAEPANAAAAASDDS